MIEIINGIEVDVIKKDVKHIRLKVTRDGKVVLNVPIRRSKQAGIDFLLQKIDWVKDKLKNRVYKSPFSFKSGETFYFFGNLVSFRIEKGAKNGYFVDDNVFILYISDINAQKIKKSFEKALKEILTQRATYYFNKWQNKTGLCRSNLTIRKTVSRWGSCNSKTGAINLSLYLVNLPEFCLDYVALHELCHLKYPNHGESFKRLLSIYLQDWKVVNKFLKEKGNSFRINL